MGEIARRHEGQHRAATEQVQPSTVRRHLVVEARP